MSSNSKRFSWKVIGWTGFLAVAAFALSLTGQAADVHPHHLVGHEEAELLLRIQDVIDDWDPRKLENPLVETSRSTEFVWEPDKDGKPKQVEKQVIRKQLRRSDLAEFIADVDAAEALGKAFFWEMQAGSDFEVTGTGPTAVAHGTACASCHYRNGADARSRHTARIPHVVWEDYDLHPKYSQLALEKNNSQLPFPVDTLATQSFNPNALPFGKYSLIVGSQGVSPHVFKGFDPPQNGWMKEKFVERPATGAASKPEWEMFGKRRQITARNSPTVINSGFSNRLFHDGRAESTFNGFSIFGDADPREVIHRVKTTPHRDADGKVTNDPPYREIVSLKIALTNAALASQAVGPIVSDVEMSYAGRQFPNVAYKLLNAKVLDFQEVSPRDSLLSRFPVGKGHPRGMKYGELIRRAFRSEWWDDSDASIAGRTPLILLQDCPQDGQPVGSLMEGNFSLYWGLSIMLYEASLVSNQSPFDEMMRGRPEMVEAKWKSVRNLIGEPVFRDQKRVDGANDPAHQSGSAVFQHGFRVFMNHGCVDCHSGPFFSELYERKPEQEKLPIEYTIERALLPNSRSDALIANLRQFREGLISELAKEVAAAYPELQSRAGKMAIELEELRHVSAGRRDRLKANVQSYLSDYPTNLNLITDCTNLIFDYEKALVSRIGNRTFFTEEERIAMAEALGGPVLVELMPIPPNLTHVRRPLPFEPPQPPQPDPLVPPKHPYAFYDASFYALGVSPPRYDRGNGSKEGFEMTEEETALLGAVADTLSNANATPEEKNFALDALRTYQETGDAAGAVEKTQSVNENKRKAYGTAPEKLIATMERKSAEGPKSKVTSSPGSAYRLKAVWRTERYQSEGYSPPRQQQPPVPPVPGMNHRTSSEAPRCEPDEKVPDEIDTSWDRDDIPFGAKNADGDDIAGAGRRSAYHFYSRARRMVFQEEHWGYRKPFLHDNELAFWGAFKTPTLRNVELTAPYMHNGRLMSLSKVIDFYDDRTEQVLPSRSENPDKHPDMEDIDFKEERDKQALEFFLRCLTDDRVLYEQGPFDHPSICIVNGYQKTADGSLEEVFFEVKTIGEDGHVGIPTSSFPSDK